MAPNAPKVTDSLKAYQRCMTAIGGFLDTVRLQGAEVWVGEVCLGSPDNPGIRAPLRPDAADLVHRAIELATALVSTVTDSIQVALETSARTIEHLKREGDVEATDLAAVTARSKALEQLLSTLRDAAGHDPFPYHPATLRRWKEILAGHLVPGSPAVTVRVTTAYAL